MDNSHDLIDSELYYMILSLNGMGSIKFMEVINKINEIDQLKKENKLIDMNNKIIETKNIINKYKKDIDKIT